MNLFTILFVCVIVFSQPSGPYRNPQFNYTFQRFVVTWPESFCQSKPCRFGYNNWDRKSFVVHGLWPSSNDPGFIKQMITGDDTCQSNQRFNAQALSSINSQLTKIMPGLAKAPQSFWKYEYDKHGSCKVFLQKLRGSTVSEDILFKQYFEQIISLYQHTVGNFRPRSSSFAGTSELARALNINPSYISVTQKNGDVVQIHFCMSETKMNYRGKPNFIPCPNAKQPRGTLNLPGLEPFHNHLSWKDLGQNMLHSSVSAEEN